MKDYVVRMHLKIKEAEESGMRNALIDFCLNGKNQLLAIGWSHLHYGSEKKSFDDFYKENRKKSKRINHVFNVFKEAEEDDLFWTRDLKGNYWICRAKGKAKSLYNKDLKIGAAIEVEAFKVGLEVPGQISSSFNRSNGGTAAGIYDENPKEPIILNYSKYIYNVLSETEYYSFETIKGNLLDNLPPFDLEELVIAYLQIEKNYYVLSNSIANKSTTVNIECVLHSRISEEKAVVQVKSYKKKEPIDAEEYSEYANNGYKVYLYAPKIIDSKEKRYEEITEDKGHIMV